MGATGSGAIAEEQARPIPVTGAEGLRRELERVRSRAWTPAEARAYCAALATGHYENFSVLSRLVPVDLRDDFAAVYAYCRWSDDLADETGATRDAREESLRLLAWWRAELDKCFAGEPGAHPVFLALGATVARHALPAQPFHRLLDAFEQDQRVTRYRTWGELLDYCTGSADPVGRIVLGLCGHRIDDPTNRELVEMSDATCTALQLTNFWQDVRRDLLERDRVYLPSDETGFSPEDLRSMAARPDDPAARAPYIKALRPLVERTRALFERGRPLPRRVDPRIAPVIGLFSAGGSSVLEAIERSGCTTLWSRPTLSRGRKAWLVGVAACRAALAGRRTAA